MPLIRWSPTIEAGHLLQALTICVGVIGGSVTGYITVLHLSAETKTEIALLRQRLDQDDTRLAELQTNERLGLDKMSSSLDKISDQVTELKVLYAGKERH